MAEIQGELDSPRTISSLRGGPHHRAKSQVGASDKDARLWDYLVPDHFLDGQTRMGLLRWSSIQGY